MSVQEKIANVNAVLRKLSQDEDLQDDLKMAAVKTALDHWTGRRRLAPETAEKLQNNRRVVYVLQRLQMLQHVCREAGMPVPLDLMLSGAAELDSPVPDISTSGTNQATSPPSSSSSPSSAREKPDTSRTAPTTAPTSSTAPTAPTAPTATTAPTAPTTPSVSPTAPPIDSKGYNFDINDALRLAIAVTFVLIAVTLAQLR